MALGEEPDVIPMVPDPITGIMPPVLGYAGPDRDFGLSEYLVMTGLLTLFAAAMVMERRCRAMRLWELLEIGVTLKVGLTFYFFPAHVFNILVGGYECDLIHTLLIQANGAAILGLAGCRIRFIASGKITKSGQSSLVFARLIGGIALLITLITDQQNCSMQDYKHKLSNLNIAFAILGCSLWILGNGVVLWNLPSFGHFCTNSRLRVNLILDILATSIFVFWCYGYPEYTLYNLVIPDFKPDGIHAHFLRTLGCLVLINVLHGIGSIRFHETVDRQGYFFSNLIVSTMSSVYFLLVPLAMSQQSSMKLYSDSSFTVYIVIISLVLINCCIGYVNPQCPCSPTSADECAAFDYCKDFGKLLAGKADACKDQPSKREPSKERSKRESSKERSKRGPSKERSKSKTRKGKA